MDDLTHLQDQLIETALEERPLALLPPGFVDRVLAQIQTTQAVAPATREVIRYKLELLDVALPILSVCLVALILGLTGHLAFLGVVTPIDWSTLLQIDWSTVEWLDVVGLLVFAELCIGAIFCVWMWLDRPLPLVGGEA